MMSNTHSYSAQRVPGSVSVTASLVTVALATLITPQIILRAFEVGRATAELYVAFAVGMVLFVLTLLAVNGVTQLTPRRTTHQLAARYVGSWAGILVGAAKILIHGLLVLLGVELVVTVVGVTFNLTAWSRFLAVALVLVLAIPTLAARAGHGLRWPRVLGFFGIVALTFVLAWGLVQEFLGAIDFTAVIQARSDAFKSDMTQGSNFPLIESMLGASFPAMMLFVISERVMAAPQRRRVKLKRMLIVLIPMVILIANTMYFVVKLELPGRRLGLPALSIAYAFFGEWGRIVAAVLFSCTGIAAAVAAYRQLPRVLRELAIDGLLPKRLAAQDSVIPRHLIVLIIALLAAVISLFLDSTRSLAMITILVAVFIGMFLALAMVARSRSILNDSIDAQERKLAIQAKWAYRGYGLCLIAVTALIVLVQPLWFVTAVVSLAVPVVFLLVHREGSGKIQEVLTAEIGEQGRVIPTRVHSFVLVEYIDLPTLQALDWARANRAASLEALCVDVDPVRTRQLRKEWRKREIPVALTIVGTPSGAARGPIIEYIRAFRATHPNDVVMVYYPRVISTGTWERFFVRHTTPSIISELQLEPGVMVTQVPYRIETAEVASASEN